MSEEERRTLVGVFDLAARAEKAAAELRAGGHDVRAVVDPADVSALAAAGVADAAYYEREGRAGRWLVMVACPAGGVAGVLGAFGRHGGSVRVPAEIRDGTN